VLTFEATGDDVGQAATGGVRIGRFGARGAGVRMGRGSAGAEAGRVPGGPGADRAEWRVASGSRAPFRRVQKTSAAPHTAVATVHRTAAVACREVRAPGVSDEVRVRMRWWAR